jgi:hypothetical protein
MIYLIDDNQSNQRQKQYCIDFVENGTFCDVLISIEQIEKCDGVLHLEFLKDAKCILLHSTIEDWDANKGFLKGSITNATKITEMIACDGDKIPLVLFSNKMSEIADYDYQKFPNFIRELKKNKFYERLYDFVVHYRNTDEIELRILALGKNFKAEEAAHLANELLRAVASLKDEDEFLITHISCKLQIFKEFIEMSLPNVNFQNILCDLEDNPINISEFQDRVNLITESFFKYGKNIHNWE